LTRRGCRLAPRPSATAARLQRHADQHCVGAFDPPRSRSVARTRRESADSSRTRPIRTTRPRWSSRSMAIRSLVHDVSGFLSRPPLASYRQSAPSPSPTKQGQEFGSRSQGICRIKSAVLLGAGRGPYQSPGRQQTVRLRRREVEQEAANVTIEAISNSDSDKSCCGCEEPNRNNHDPCAGR
jgi:hypothetical protein